ncbi:hypothetical protein FOMPIDRAFT_1052356 [Fomitopsis schrenkii]|uniref:Uncharacterized protein n=1 Tax=Fomitopsis schrenkii TaxID=2126942 RepID=S8FG37_FOMSC|nr:hypothetical protein FOMPIDRAFT_1052356 [Fomitopsis schrenkii]
MTNQVSTVHGQVAIEFFLPRPSSNFVHRHNTEFDDPVEVTCAELATLVLSLHPVHGETREHAIVQNVEFSTLGQKWIEDRTIVKRLYNIVTSSDVNSGRYNIYNSLPLNTHWRSPGLADWRQRLMAGKLPVTFWVCGEVNRLGARFARASGEQLPIVSINLTPSRIGESVQWLSYLDSFGGWQPEIRALNNVCARKHMALPSGYSDTVSVAHIFIPPRIHIELH